MINKLENVESRKWSILTWLTITNDEVKWVLELWSLWVQMTEVYSSQISDNDIFELTTLTSNGFWIQMSFEDVKNHIQGSDIVYLLKENGSIKGYSSMKFLDGLVYRFWTVFSPEMQSRWIYTEFNSQMIEKYPTMFLRTQNASVVKSFTNLWVKVRVWKWAQRVLQQMWTWPEFENFFKWDNLKDWVFKWVYWGFLWNPKRTKFITDTEYAWFQADKWDALLVLIEKI